MAVGRISKTNKNKKKTKMNPILGEYTPIRKVDIRTSVPGKVYSYYGNCPNIPLGAVLGVLSLKRLVYIGDRKNTTTEYMCKFSNYCGYFETDDMLLEMDA